MSELTGAPIPRFATLVDLLERRAADHPDRLAYTFLADGESVEIPRPYGQLAGRARAIAAWLQRRGARQQRVLLLFPPGLEFLDAFFGCLYAGAVAVPAYPPRPNRPMRHVEDVAADSGAALALSVGEMVGELRQRFAESGKLAAVALGAADEIDDGEADAWQPPEVAGADLAFLQYTSGSTGTPKGVMVTHENVLVCEELIFRAFEHTTRGLGLGWLPLHHDMGLIGNALQAVYIGTQCILMSPVAFLQKPLRWLQGISRYRATTSGGPNFAYEMCIRSITAEQKETLDLRSWDVAFTGAEPVRADTLRRFVEAFRPCGFRPEAFYPCYGMAEATLIVTGGKKRSPPVVRRLDRPALRAHRAVVVGNGDAGRDRTAGEDPEGCEFVECGGAMPGHRVAIVDPETGAPCAEGEIGEIWISGPTIAKGYWNRPELSAETFAARLPDSPDRAFLRSGDLGFLHGGQLVVTGRLKNVIILRGRNYYPQDIERTVSGCHEALRPDGGAVFAVETEREPRLVVAHEVERSRLRNLDVDELAAAVCQAVAEEHDLRVDTVLLMKPSGIPRTSSGKVRHHACRDGFLEGTLPVVARWDRRTEEEDEEAGPAEVHSDGALPAAGLPTVETIREWLVAELARRLGVAEREIDASAPFVRYGLDSVTAVAVAESLSRWLGRPLPPTLAYDYPSIELLSRHLGIAADASGTSRAKTTGERTHAEPIALVGLACRFPGADSPQEFWRVLHEGIDCIGPAPPDRRHWAARWSHPEGAELRNWTWGGFLDRVDQFDPAPFGISTAEAENMDPQHRILLESAWEALEHAGIAPDRLGGTATGVFIGISGNDYARLQQADAAAVNAFSGTGNALSIAANRLSYVFDLRGPSLVIDTACSSSLVAVHQACESLRRRESDLALAGGVNLILSPDVTHAFDQAGILAGDGRCKTFDASADGYVRGEGCGVVVLKRLSDAQRDGDRVLAVVRGSAVNQDGRTNGLTAPNGPAQQAVVRQALGQAGVRADEVGCIEAHGTGTALGDPIEVNSLRAVLDAPPPRGAGEDAPPCAIGSVKTNIGHLEAAAGIAGLIKVVLALEHEEIPPNLHLNTLNPHIELAGSRLTIPTRPMPWPRGRRRRIAGVSSFGFGGTNAHVIVEEAPPAVSAREDPEPSRPVECLFTLSACDERALRAGAGRCADALAGHGALDLSDLCRTAAVGRARLEHRLAVVAGSVEQLRAELQAFAQRRPSRRLALGKAPRWEPRRLAFLFTAEGAEYPGMGRGLYCGDSAFRRAIDRCDALLRPLVGRPLLDLLDPQPGDECLLDQAACAQPALFALEYALAELWKSWGIEPAMVAGEGVGEYAAACAAGVFSLEDALKLVVHRAALMQSEGVFGDGDFDSCRREVVFHPPKLEIVGGVDGRLAGAEMAQPAYWRRPMRRAARFADCVKTLAERGAEIFLEIGPKPVLTELGKRCLAGQGRSTWLASLRDAGDDWAQMLGSLRDLYLRGAPVDWQGFHGGGRRGRVALPTYAFQQKRYWYALPSHDPPSRKPPADADPAGSHPLLGRRLRTAGSQSIYESRLEPASAEHLRDHRIAGRAVLSLGSFLEMAVAAPAGSTETETWVVRDLCIARPLVLSDAAASTVQTVLTPTDHGAASFEVFRLREGGDGSEATWESHATGRVCRRLDGAEPPRIDPEAVASRSTEPVETDAYYAQCRERGFEFGPSLCAVHRLWRGPWQARAEIRLPDLSTSTAPYRAHPAALDAALQVVGAAVAEVAGRASYLPESVKQFTLWGPLESSLACHVQLTPPYEPRPAALSVEVVLFTPDGRVVAEMTGLKLRRVPREALLRGGESLEDLIYETHWQKAPPAADRWLRSVPPPQAICRQLEAEVDRLRTDPQLQRYVDLLAGLDRVALGYVVGAFRAAEWPIEPGETVSLSALAERLGIVTSHRRLAGRLLEMLAEEGILEKLSDGWRVVRLPETSDPRRQVAEWIEQFPSAEAELTLLDRCGAALADVLRGRLDPLEVLFPGGDAGCVERLYRDSPGARVMNRLVVEAVAEVARRRPADQTLRVLEIGAGTGGTTAVLLPRLPRDRTEYAMTDVSPLFTALAREKFADYPFVRHEVLDIERPPEEQGFPNGAYDVVLAANVLHATRDLRRSVGHAAGLLADGGLLVLLEGTRAQRWLDLIFGLTEGWWRFDDAPLRTAHPLLSATAWQDLLTECGLEGPACVTPTVSENDHGSQAVILARGRRRTSPPALADWLILADRQGLGDRLAELLRAAGARSTVARRAEPRTARPAPGEPDVVLESDKDFEHVLAGLAPAGSARPLGIVHLWSLDAAGADQLDLDALQAAGRLGCGATLRLLAAAEAAGLGERVSLFLVTREAAAVGPGPAASGLAQSTLWGLGNAIPLEHPNVRCTSIDLGPPTPEDARLLFDEILPAGSAGSADSAATEDRVAIRNGRRFVHRLLPGRLPRGGKLALRADASYLVTGGLGTLGLRTADWLVAQGARHLMLVGRTGLPDRDRWNDLPRDCRAWRQVEAIRRLEGRGVRIDVCRADVGDPWEMGRLFDWLREAGVPLRGVVHAAGASHYQPLARMTFEGLEAVLRPKVYGAWLLLQHAKRCELDFFVCFSSTASHWGTKGQGHYSAANGFLDLLAHYAREQGVPALSVNWGLWAGGGLADEVYRAWMARQGIEPPEAEEAFDSFGGRADAAYRAWLEQLGIEQLQPEQALESLRLLLASDAVHATVAKVDWQRLDKTYQMMQRPSLLREVLRHPRPDAAARAPAGPEAAQNELRRSLLRATPDERKTLLVRHVRQQIAQMLGVEASQVDVGQPINNLGLDSLMAIELRNRVKTDLGIDIPMVTFMEGPNIAEMAGDLDEQLAGQGAQIEPRRARDASSPPQPSPRRGTGEEGGRPAERLAALPAEAGPWVEGEL
jgi:acyl transferase domain-containing protein/acyl-CoA synthetase (AMP-forming)/AMP-acid ligase II/NAD(P)-dependent dehydrogenase (short-subunit alcohol dehydrogenase family)/acyl carrier protein/SAM-dependent methyltransferase